MLEDLDLNSSRANSWGGVVADAAVDAAVNKGGGGGGMRP